MYKVETTLDCPLESDLVGRIQAAYLPVACQVIRTPQDNIDMIVLYGHPLELVAQFDAWACIIDDEQRISRRSGANRPDSIQKVRWQPVPYYHVEHTRGFAAPHSVTCPAATGRDMCALNGSSAARHRVWS